MAWRQRWERFPLLAGGMFALVMAGGVTGCDRTAEDQEREGVVVNPDENGQGAEQASSLREGKQSDGT